MTHSSTTRGWPRTIAVLVGALALTLLPGAMLNGASAVAPSSTSVVDQCNVQDNGGGRGVSCAVTVYNYYDFSTGDSRSSTVTVACSGPANTTPLPFCVTTTIPSTSLVTSVTQCNGSTNGGGASLICHVTVRNHFVGGTTATAASVDQCQGSGDVGTAPTLNCGPNRADGPGSAVVQCNGSGNGGGGSLIVTCGVGASTTSADWTVRVNQCNGSSNGGGGTVLCDVDMQNFTLPTFADTDADDTGGPASTTTVGTPTPNPVGTVSAATGFSAPAETTTAALADSGANVGAPALVAGMSVLLGGGILLFVARRNRPQKA